MLYLKRLNFEKRFVATFNTEPGAGTGTKTEDPGAKGGTGGGAPDPMTMIADLQKQIEALKSGNPNPPKKNEEDPDLQERARRERAKADGDSARTRQLENAIKFNLKSEDFLKQNETLLPKDVQDIFKQADKENFSDAIEKDSAIKSGLVQSFFAVQANVDLLTPGQRTTLDDYLKLTKTEKQNRAQQVYDMVFEPAFETLKRVKRAEALSKGYGNGSDAETAYKQKLMASTRKHYLGEK